MSKQSESSGRARKTRSFKQESKEPADTELKRPSPPISSPTYEVEDGQVNLPYLPKQKPLCRPYVLELIKKEIEKRWNKDYMEPFQEPVNEITLDLPDYYFKIKHPMDMGTVLKRLQHKYYADPSECYNDMKLVVENCMIFNDPDSYVVGQAKILSSEIEEIERTLPHHRKYTAWVDSEGNILNEGSSRSRKRSESAPPHGSDKTSQLEPEEEMSASQSDLYSWVTFAKERWASYERQDDTDDTEDDDDLHRKKTQIFPIHVVA
ncbi:bromodomain-containing protein 4-like [Cloeon dipterum]|uniref:bromodomain-containing protein 4-like n=1 Tax=Cloeon dipterum TaxID=197152 RepID=UPI0032207736